jgi:predicted  nucleic acid-binding Zn-ribbon protein
MDNKEKPKRGRGRPRKSPEQKKAEQKQASDRKNRLAKIHHDIHALEMHMESSIKEKEKLENEEAALRDHKETYQESYSQYLEQAKEDTQREAVTKEQAIAVIQAQSKMSQLDRVMGAKAGFGSRRPTFFNREGKE